MNNFYRQNDRRAAILNRKIKFTANRIPYSFLGFVNGKQRPMMISGESHIGIVRKFDNGNIYIELDEGYVEEVVYVIPESIIEFIEIFQGIVPPRVRRDL